MTPTTETGLATHSVYHGCSTGCIREWTLVTKKGKKNTNIKKDEVPQDGTSYLKALLRIDDKEKKVAPTENQGSPPNDNYCATLGSNRYDALSDDGAEEEIYYDAVCEDIPPPAPKRRKTIHSDDKTEDSNKLIEEFKNMPPPDYAYSAQEAKTARMQKQVRSDDDYSSSQEYEKVEDVRRTTISCSAADYMDCSEDIYAYENNYHTRKFDTNEHIKQASDQVLDELDWKC